MKRNSTLNTSALVLAATAALFTGTAQAQTNAPTPAAPPPPSAGLVNDLLRKQSDAFQAWDIGGQIRARYEMKQNFAAPGQAGAIDFRDKGGNPHNDYLILREKVHIGYSQPWFGVFAQGRNSSVGGDDRDPNPDADKFDLQQGYVRLGNPKKYVTLQAGRQELLYGDERLVGSLDWANIPRTFDALKLRVEGSAGWVDAFTSHPVLADDGSFNGYNEYETFSGVYASTKKLIPKQESQLYFLSRNASVQSPFAHQKDVPQSGGATARDIYTVGLRVKSTPGQFAGFDYGAELMYQFGRYKEGGATLAAAKAQKSLDHEAFAAFVGGGYTATNIAGAPRLGVEYNYASGDDNPNDGDHGTFDNLYPTNHKFYGLADFVSLQNIHNLRFMSSISPVKDFSIALDYHLFWLADTADNFYTVTGARRGGTASTTGNGYGINKGYDSFVGSELDLTLTYKFKNHAIAQVGYAHFFTGDYIDQSLSSPAFGSKDADYLYLQLTFNF